MSQMTQRGYAKYRGCSLAAVQKAIATGRIKLGPDGKIDHLKADQDWKAKTNHRTSADANGGDPEELMAAKTRKESALADLRELEVKKKAGQLVDVAAMESAWATIGQTMRDALLSLPERLAPQVAAVSDVRLCRDILQKEIRAVIGNIPGQLRAAVNA